MILRLEYYATADVVLHKRVAALRAHLQLFFLRLFFMTDGAGRFRADAAEIRASLYAHELQQVSQREVESRLHELHRARLIKLYTEGDVGYGKVADEFWQQRDRLRKVRHPDASPPDAGSLFPGSPTAPPAIGKKPKATRVCESPPPLTSLPVSSVQSPASDLRPAAECLAELQARYPRHDVPAQIRAATRYVRRQRQDETAEVPVGWFVVHWLSKAAEKPPRHNAPASATPAHAAALEAETARWQAEQTARMAAIVAGPEPAPGTIDHAIWLEGRKSA